jgi:hypothetical protein
MQAAGSHRGREVDDAPGEFVRLDFLGKGDKKWPKLLD